MVLSVAAFLASKRKEVEGKMDVKVAQKITKVIFLNILVILFISGCGVHNLTNNEESNGAIADEYNTTEQATQGQITQEQTAQDKATLEKTTQKKTSTHDTTAETTKKAENTTTTINNDETEKADEISKEDAVVDFSRCAFVGDSRIKSIEEQKITDGADFFSSVGIDIGSVKTKQVYTDENGAKCTLLQALYEKQYDKIYVMLGINDLGWPEEQFCKYYEEIIKDIRENCSESEIYTIAILPMVESRTDEVYNNKVINKFNGFIEKISFDNGCKFIDASSVVEKEDGTLPEEASNDGIHLKSAYNIKILKYLKEL